MSPDKPITVEIYKQTYQLGASEGRDAEYIQRAAAYLDEKMQQAAAEVGNRAPLDIAILAALNIAEEVLSAREQKETLLDQTDAHIDSFTQLLSNADPPEDPPPSSNRFYSLYIVLRPAGLSLSRVRGIERTTRFVCWLESSP
jgi:cell division protein ZapA (FtsZ GTPase activity inhibitor)